MPVIRSVNVGTAQTVEWHGRRVTTGIWKSPVSGRVRIVRHHVDGDVQANPKVHGGPRKAVYAYPADHYDFWRRELGGISLPWGSFGENLTVEGIAEGEVCVGDLWEAGSAVLEVTQPRSPCSNLNVKFDREDMVRTFWESGRSGFYLAVVAVGEVAAGDPFRRTQPSPGSRSIAAEFRRSRDRTSPG
ncbi:MAG: MOSC domain-containing protein [Thermoplasmata archaeon]|nr:MOSC domain-containing protein [Thermoplasmata archaeon]